MNVNEGVASHFTVVAPKSQNEITYQRSFPDCCCTIGPKCIDDSQIQHVGNKDLISKSSLVILCFSVMAQIMYEVFMLHMNPDQNPATCDSM